MFDTDYIGSAEERVLAELKTATQCFDDAQWPLMVAASSVCPGLLQVSLTNPAMAYMLANYRAFVFECDGVPWRPVAQRLGLRRRGLLGWLGWPERESSVRLVSKIAMPGITVADMQRLRGLCAGGSTLKLLRHLPTITAEVIRIADDPASVAHVTYSFLEDVVTLEPSTPASQLLAEVIRLAQLHGARLRKLRDYGELEMHYLFFSEAEYGVVAEWNPQYEGVDLDLPVTAPTIPRYTQPIGVRLERFHSARELYEWAKAEHNCAFSLIEEVVSGHRVLLKVLEPVRGTLSLVAHEDTWLIDQFRAARNQPVPRSALLTVAAYLNQRLARG